MIRSHSDSDWAGCRETRRSTSSGTIQLGPVGHVVDHYSVHQQVIALSSAEAEYYATGKAAAHSLHVQSTLSGVGTDVQISLFTDSAAAKSICSRRGMGSKLRHVQLRYLWVQERLAERASSLLKVASCDNVAGGTKILLVEVLVGLLRKLGFSRVTG